MVTGRHKIVNLFLGNRMVNQLIEVVIGLDLLKKIVNAKAKMPNIENT